MYFDLLSVIFKSKSNYINNWYWFFGLLKYYLPSTNKIQRNVVSLILLLFCRGNFFKCYKNYTIHSFLIHKIQLMPLPHNYHSFICIFTLLISHPTGQRVRPPELGIITQFSPMQMWRLRKTHMGTVELNKISIFLYGGRCILSNFMLHKRKLRRDSCSSSTSNSSCMLHAVRCMWVVFGCSANCSCIVISGDAIIISSASETKPSPASSSSSSSLWSS